MQTLSADLCIILILCSTLSSLWASDFCHRYSFAFFCVFLLYILSRRFCNCFVFRGFSLLLLLLLLLLLWLSAVRIIQPILHIHLHPYILLTRANGLSLGCLQKAVLFWKLGSVGCTRSFTFLWRFKTLCCRIHVERMVVSQLVLIISALYGIPNFIIAVTKDARWHVVVVVGVTSCTRGVQISLTVYILHNCWLLHTARSQGWPTSPGPNPMRT